MLYRYGEEWTCHQKLIIDVRMVTKKGSKASPLWNRAPKSEEVAQSSPKESQKARYINEMKRDTMIGQQMKVKA